jgi:EAL domain-containing protein (putative c-di-GMP-specific phosphodiesterase class I)
MNDLELNLLALSLPPIIAIQHEDVDAPIITTIICMANNKKLKVIADSVETIGSSNFFRKYRCNPPSLYRLFKEGHFRRILGSGSCNNIS